MPGLNKYDEKLKREQRRRNHIARDLATPKYRKQVVPHKFWHQEYDRIEDEEND